MKLMKSVPLEPMSVIFEKSVDGREVLTFFIFCPNNLCSILI